MSEKVVPAGVEPVQEETYGATMTAKGLQLISKIITTNEKLTLVKVMMGSGTPPPGTYIGDLEDLVEPVAAGTVSEPIYQGNTVEMTVEYRNDLNGGLQEGFIIREFGIFAKDPDGGEVMIFYGNLSKYPQYIAPYTGGGLDVRRYPVSLTVAEGTVVILDGLPGAVMTLDDVRDYCMTTLLPQLLSSTNAQIDAHDEDENAHPDIRLALKNTLAQVTQAVESAKQEVSDALDGMSSELEETKKDVAKELAGSAGRFYIDFEPEDWQDGELRFAREEHGLDPAAGICGSFIRGLMGRSVRDMLTEEDAQAAGSAIIAAMAEALSANSAAEEDPKPYPPADDGHIPFTWEQTQYAILEGKIAPVEDVARIAEEKGFNWQERDTLRVPETTALDELLTAAYLPALQGSDTNFRKLCTLEALQGLRLRKKDVPYDVEKYDMDGEMMTIWATWDGKVHFDAQTGDLVLESEKPYAGDLLVIA